MDVSNSIAIQAAIKSQFTTMCQLRDEVVILKKNGELDLAYRLALILDRLSDEAMQIRQIAIGK